MDDPEEGALSPGALLKTMAVAALLAAVVSACGKSIDKPVVPKPPMPKTTMQQLVPTPTPTPAPAPVEVSRAIFSMQPGSPVFYLDGDNARRGRLVIRT